MSPTKTIITHDRSLAALFQNLRVYALDRSFEAYGPWVEHPVWAEASRSVWAPDGSQGEVSFTGNFYLLSFAFGVQTNDPALIERLRAAVEANMSRPDYLAQPAPAMSIRLLREYLMDSGLHREDYGDAWAVDRTEITLEPVDDTRLMIVHLRHHGATHRFTCDRRAMVPGLIVLARSRRPDLGFSSAQIVGDLEQPEPGTLAAAIRAGEAAA